MFCVQRAEWIAAANSNMNHSHLKVIKDTVPIIYQFQHANKVWHLIAINHAVKLNRMLTATERRMPKNKTGCFVSVFE